MTDAKLDKPDCQRSSTRKRRESSGSSNQGTEICLERSQRKQIAYATDRSGKTIAFMTLIQGMIDGKVISVVLLSPTNFYEKQHIDVSTALVKGRPQKSKYWLS
jgi:hypothetical protein